MPHLFSFEIQNKFKFSACNGSLGYCFFQKWRNSLGKAKSLYILEHLSHPHMLGTGPAPAKFLQSRTSICWQPGFVSPCRNTVVIGNCDLRERNKPSEPSGSLSVCAVKACSEVVLLQKQEHGLVVGQWAPGRLVLLPPVPQHLCTGSRSSRGLREAYCPKPCTVP